MLSSLKRNYRKIIINLDKSVSKWYFRESLDPKYKCYKNKPFLHTPLSGLPSIVRDSFSTYNNIEQEEYYAIIDGIHYIEPTNSWIFNKQLNTYYSCSTPYSYLEEKPLFSRIKLRRHKILKFDTVISIRYYFSNYWHFFNDVLGQISLIDEKGVDKSTPIILPDGVLEIGFIKQVIESSNLLKDRNWVVLKKGMLIEANRVLVAKNLPNTKLNIIRILRLIESNPIEVKERKEEKLFLKRGANRTRKLSNSGDLERIAVKYGLKIIDTDSLSFEDQKEIFANASLIVGIHGAGLTNIIFRWPNHLKLVEIFPKNLIPPHYYWLAHQLDFTYDCVIGEDEIADGFFLDPVIFENCLKKNI